jgi:uroporphyrinogen decarboxylase
MLNKSSSRTAQHVQKTLHCEPTDNRCLFMPAIYEHKGWFIGETPSAISRDAKLLAGGVLKEYEQLTPDALAIGIDVYNLEAEAVGCKVTYYEGDDISIPGISPGNHVIKIGEDISSRQAPNPLTDGRMPVNIEAARLVVKEVGDDVWVRGAISGPFSLAVSMVGAEDLFMATLDDPDFVHTLMAYTVDMIKAFGQAYIDVGADVIMFDSQASADLLPPDMYDEFIVGHMKELISYFKKQGVMDVPLVIGGTTTPMIDTLIETGSNNLLCDYNCDWPTWVAQCKKHNRAVRRNIDSNYILNSTPDDIYNTAESMIKEADRYPGYIMGTAVIPYGTPTENLLAIKQACIDSVA